MPDRTATRVMEKREQKRYLTRFQQYMVLTLAEYLILQLSDKAIQSHKLDIICSPLV